MHDMEILQVAVHLPSKEKFFIVCLVFKLRF